VVPQKRGELEEFIPEVIPLEDNPELEASHTAWCESRDRNGSKPEKHYSRGTAPDGLVATEHQTRLQLQEFKRKVVQ
jgi:hypothetical protein